MKKRKDTQILSPQEKSEELLREDTTASEDGVDQKASQTETDSAMVEPKDVKAEEIEAGAIQADTVPAEVIKTGILIQKSHLWIGAAVAVALILCGFFFGFHFQKEATDGLTVDPGAKQYGQIQAIPKNENPDGISVPMFTKIVFPANETEVKIVLLNPEGNPCYFRYTLRVGEEKEVLYQSGLIPPGMAVTDLTLARALEEGEYALEIVVETFSQDEERVPMNGATENAVLYVH